MIALAESNSHTPLRNAALVMQRQRRSKLTLLLARPGREEGGHRFGVSELAAAPVETAAQFIDAVLAIVDVE